MSSILYSPKFINGVALSKAALIFLITLCGTTVIFAQSFDRIERGRAKTMLNNVKKAIKDDYYDTKYHGVDLEARFKAAEEKLATATSIGQAFGIIAQAVMELNDSHTVFYPPSRAAKFEYGWRMQMIGDKCLVTAVKPKSDAEVKGLKIGDEILSVEGFRPNRKELWKLDYYYNALSPRNGLNVKVQSPESKETRELNIAAKVDKLKAVLNIEDLLREYEIDYGRTIEHRFIKIGNTTAWQMPTFIIEPDSIDGIMQSRVKQSNNLILDLRGNGGGYVVALERLAGYFVEKDTKVADLKGRKEMKPQMAKTKGKDIFRGRLIVLIDSKSGSASEIFARFVQLEKRGVVIGDVSSGAVMQSRGVPMQVGADTVVPYGMNLTNADVIMTDGKSIEYVGVTPNLLSVPTNKEVASRLDIALSTSFKLLDENVTPEQAGKMFPFKWRQD